MCIRQEDCLAVCEEETILSESGTMFTWLETRGREIATLICPLNNKFSITRRCSFLGEWQEFDEYGCGNVSQQLGELRDTFNNVSVIIASDSQPLYNAMEPLKREC